MRLGLSCASPSIRPVYQASEAAGRVALPWAGDCPDARIRRASSSAFELGDPVGEHQSFETGSASINSMKPPCNSNRDLRRRQRQGFRRMDGAAQMGFELRPITLQIRVVQPIFERLAISGVVEKGLLRHARLKHGAKGGQHGGTLSGRRIALGPKLENPAICSGCSRNSAASQLGWITCPGPGSRPFAGIRMAGRGSSTWIVSAAAACNSRSWRPH